jgi:hypothetical protein
LFEKPQLNGELIVDPSTPLRVGECHPEERGISKYGEEGSQTCLPAGFKLIK